MGPPSDTLVADALSGLIRADSDPTAHVWNGRYINADGTLTRVPVDNPVGVWVLPPGVTRFAPGTGTVYAVAGAQLSAGCAASATALSWMDYDGIAQPAADESTGGVLVAGPAAGSQRVYVDVYADLGGASTCGSTG